jgi:hypothetical protein
VFAECNYILIYPSQQGELTAEIITGSFSYAVKRCRATKNKKKKRKKKNRKKKKKKNPYKWQ